MLLTPGLVRLSDPRRMAVVAIASFHTVARSYRGALLDRSARRAANGDAPPARTMTRSSGERSHGLCSSPNSAAKLSLHCFARRMQVTVLVYAELLTFRAEACPCCRRPDCDHRPPVPMLDSGSLLEADNAHLVASAQAFGELPARLNEQLREKWRRKAHLSSIAPTPES